MPPAPPPPPHPTPPPPGPGPGALVPVVLVGLFTGLRLAYAGLIELSADEAYYWVWGQRLAFGYFDHPPAIAWLIRLGTAIFGDTEQGVRFFPLLAGGAAAMLAARLVAPRQRELLVLALLTLPLFALGGLLATPDVPLLLAWTGGLVAAARGRWAWVGVAAGAAMMSKYTGVLLLPLIVLAQPRALATRGPWVAALVALGLYLPNLAWNAENDLVSFRFQLDHVTQDADRAAFLGAQVGLVGLLAPAVAAWALVAWRGDPLDRLLWWASVPVFAVAAASSGEANWAAPAFIGPVIGLARREGRWAQAAWAGVGVNLVLVAFVMVHMVHPLIDLPQDPRARVSGGRNLAMAVEAQGVPAVYTSRYQEAALIHFYAGIEASALPELGRGDQYDLWGVTLADEALFVRPWRGADPVATEALGYSHGPAAIVSAHLNTAPRGPEAPIGAREIGVWQVYPISRAPSP